MGWLSGWSYRKPVTITEQSGSDLIDYQVKVVVDTASLVSAGKMNADGSDIRFTDSDGATLLNFWIEDGTMNTTTTNIWVKVPSIPANENVTIYMYYGNPTATSASDVSMTALDVIPDLEIYIPFDEGSGSIANDYSGNGINGTLSAGVGWTTGRFGGAVNFPDSNNKKVTYGTVPSITGTSITLLAWVYRTATNSTGWNIVASKWFTETGAGSTQDFHFDTTNYGQIRLYTNGSYRGAVNINFSNNQWRHIGFAVDQSTNRVHFIADGQIKYTTSGNRPVSSASALMNGDARNGFGLIGYIDSFMIFKRVLTSTELSNIYTGKYLTNSAYPNKLIVFSYIQQEPTTSVGSEETNWPKEIIFKYPIYYVPNTYKSKATAFVTGSGFFELYLSPDGLSWELLTPGTMKTLNTSSDIWYLKVKMLEAGGSISYLKVKFE